MINDFNIYDDALEVLKHDLFIDKDGKYYKIKRTVSKDNTSHNIWARDFLLRRGEVNLSKNLNDVELLIHKYGFTYYSHDGLLYKPIIKIPNPIYYKRTVTDEQIDSLIEIMLLNGENPFKVPFINKEDNIYDYVEINNESGVTSENIYKRLRKLL